MADQWRPLARGARELTTTQLIRAPWLAQAEGRERSEAIARELHNRASFALLPIVLVWLRWRGGLNGPPAAVAVAVVAFGYGVDWRFFFLPRKRLKNQIPPRLPPPPPPRRPCFFSPPSGCSPPPLLPPHLLHPPLKKWFPGAGWMFPPPPPTHPPHSPPPHPSYPPTPRTPLFNSFIYSRRPSNTLAAIDHVGDRRRAVQARPSGSATAACRLRESSASRLPSASPLKTSPDAVVSRPRRRGRQELELPLPLAGRGIDRAQGAPRRTRRALHALAGAAGEALARLVFGLPRVVGHADFARVDEERPRRRIETGRPEVGAADDDRAGDLALLVGHVPGSSTGRPSAPISLAHVVVTNGLATMTFPFVRSSV